MAGSAGTPPFFAWLMHRRRPAGAHGLATIFDGKPASVVAWVSLAEVALSGSKVTVAVFLSKSTDVEVTPGTRSRAFLTTIGQVPQVIFFFNCQGRSLGRSGEGEAGGNEAHQTGKSGNDATHGDVLQLNSNGAYHGNAMSAASTTATTQNTCRCRLCSRGFAQASPGAHRAGTK